MDGTLEIVFWDALLLAAQSEVPAAELALG
jgi:hypothetical protein